MLSHMQERLQAQKENRDRALKSVAPVNHAMQARRNVVATQAVDILAGSLHDAQ